MNKKNFEAESENLRQKNLKNQACFNNIYGSYKKHENNSMNNIRLDMSRNKIDIFNKNKIDSSTSFKNGTNNQNAIN